MDSFQDIKLGIVRGVSYGVFGPPAEFMAPLRGLGAGLARVYLTWNQVEPEAGRYDWTAVDALLRQIELARIVPNPARGPLSFSTRRGGQSTSASRALT